MKRLVTLAMVIFVMMFGTTCFASENETVIHEREVSTVSREITKNEVTIITTIVEIDDETLIKIEKIYSYNGGSLKKYFVRYLYTDGTVKAAYGWEERNGKKFHEYGKRVVTIITEK